MTTEEMLRDLALVFMEDSPPQRDLGFSDTRMKVQIFLRDLELRPGDSAGVEICSLYRYFKYWLLWVDRKASLPIPRSFCRAVHALGFVRGHRCRAGGRDRRLLSMRKDSAERVLEWLKRHPDTPEDRALFQLRRQT